MVSRTVACHAGGREFDPRRSRQFQEKIQLVIMPVGFFHLQAHRLTAFLFSDTRFAGAMHFIKGDDLRLLRRNRQVLKCLS
jgi:hypothetical protein